jgi:hypothetical protein
LKSFNTKLTAGVPTFNEIKSQDLISCKNVLNFKKFKNLNWSAAHYCIDPEAGYEIDGNFN